MKNIFILYTFLICFSANAQPGYMGKRLSFSYNLNFSPIISGDNYKGESRPFVDFNNIHSVRLDYVTSRKNSIGIQAGFFRTSLKSQNFDYQNSSDYYDNYDYTYVPPYTEYEFFEGGHAFKLYSFMYGLNYRKYHSSGGNLAPIGSYTEIGIGAQHQFVYDKLVDDYITNNFAAYISIAFGTQRVFFDRMLFDISLRFAFYPQFLISNIAYLNIAEPQTERYFPNLTYSERMEQLQKSAMNRGQFLDIVTLKIGLGTLL